MIQKSIWIRCYEERQAKQVKNDLLEFIREEPVLAGNIPVNVFAAKTRGLATLSHIYDVSEVAINVLKEKYGDENVKMVEHEFSEDCGHKSVGERIAESLERIADILNDIKIIL